MYNRFNTITCIEYRAKLVMFCYKITHMYIKTWICKKWGNAQVVISGSILKIGQLQLKTNMGSKKNLSFQSKDPMTWFIT